MKVKRFPKCSASPERQSSGATGPRFSPRAVYSQDEAPGAGAKPDETPKVLIAEDDYLVASQMEDALTRAGFVVFDVVSTAEDAIERARAGGVALVVMDVRLAGKRDGVDAATELFQQHGIRSIFATAHADPEIRKRAEKATPAGWLQKPYSMASLVAVVRAATETKGSKH